MHNLEVWKIKEKDCNLFQKKLKQRPQRHMTMEDFWRPSIQDEYPIVRQPTIEGSNFELKPALITMI